MDATKNNTKKNINNKSELSNVPCALLKYHHHQLGRSYSSLKFCLIVEKLF